MRRGGVLLALWVVVAFTAIGVGTWALSLVGGEINDGAAAPLSSAQIDSALHSADRAGQGGAQPSETPPAGRAGRAERDTTVMGATRGLSTAGGSARATCRGTSADLAYLDTWHPDPGYHVDSGHVLRGPAPTATVVFESDVNDDVLLTVTCVNGMPTKSVRPEADDHGGDRSGDGDGATATTGGGTATSGDGGTGGGGGGTSGGSGGSSGGSPAPTPSPTDDHGGHGTDDLPGDDHGGG